MKCEFCLCKTCARANLHNKRTEHMEKLHFINCTLEHRKTFKSIANTKTTTTP